MKIKHTIAAVTTAAALGVALVGAVSAGPPQHYGVITCDAYGDPDNPMSDPGWWTKKDIAAYKRDMPFMDDCANGSIGFQELPPPA